MVGALFNVLLDSEHADNIDDAFSLEGLLYQSQYLCTFTKY